MTDRTCQQAENFNARDRHAIEFSASARMNLLVGIFKYHAIERFEHG